MQDAYDRAIRTYDRNIRTAERMIRAGATFDQVEEYVDALELGDKEKTVVWLMAWASLPRPDRLRIIEQSDTAIKLLSAQHRAAT